MEGNGLPRARPKCVHRVRDSSRWQPGPCYACATGKDREPDPPPEPVTVTFDPSIIISKEWATKPMKDYLGPKYDSLDLS